MNEQLQSKLVEIIAAIQSGVDKSAGFALDQFPDVAQQYVTYARVWSVALALILASVLALYAILVRKALAGDYDLVPVAAIGGPIAIGVAIWLISAVNTAAFAWIAPKAWLIQELAGLLK